MSSFAKNEKGEYVYANQMNFNTSEIFYCANEHCTAKLKIKAFDSVNVQSHFSALKNHPHTELCPYKKSYSYNKMDYSDLNIIDFYNNILNANYKSKKGIEKKEKNSNLEVVTKPKNSRSIKSLYSYISSLDINDYIENNLKVKDFLVSKSTYHYYKKGYRLEIKGLKLIECAFAKMFYCHKSHVFKIMCSYHFDYDIDHKPKIKLDFSNDKHAKDLFFEYTTKMNKIRDDNNLNNSKVSYPRLLVLGVVGDDLTVKITNKKQVVFL